MRISSIASQIGRELAGVGQAEAALAQCQKARALLANASDDINDAARMSLKTQGLMDLGDAYAALAQSDKTPNQETQKVWGEARSVYFCSLHIWHDLKERRTLTGENASKPQAAVDRVAKCDSALANGAHEKGQF